MYESGLGVSKNNAEAFKYYGRAAQLTMSSLELRLKLGTVVPALQ